MELKNIEDSDYYVSDTGELFKKVALVESNGYLKARYYKKPDTRQRIEVGMHRLLAQAFITNTENKPQINHKDGNKSNNSLDNLEWVNNSENIQHAYDNNLIDRTKKRLLNDETIKLIQEIYIPGNKEFGTRALGRKFNVSPNCISYYINKLKL